MCRGAANTFTSTGEPSIPQVTQISTASVDLHSAYVTYQDIRSLGSLREQTVIAIKAPPETRLEVPDPENNIQIWLKSTRGAIDVFLCPDDLPGDDSSSSSARSSDSTASATDGHDEVDGLASSDLGNETQTDQSKPHYSAGDRLSERLNSAESIKQELFSEESSADETLLLSPSCGSSLFHTAADPDMPFMHINPTFNLDEDYLFGVSENSFNELLDAYDLGI
ncbi:Transcription factor e2f2 [Bulinus truncatus]|nr:Transcription factor e2f2 [Bulinus truncatus]